MTVYTFLDDVLGSLQRPVVLEYVGSVEVVADDTVTPVGSDGTGVVEEFNRLAIEQDTSVLIRERERQFKPPPEPYPMLSKYTKHITFYADQILPWIVVLTSGQPTAPH